jgi:hypothetical protein
MCNYEKHLVSNTNKYTKNLGAVKVILIKSYHKSDYISGN